MLKKSKKGMVVTEAEHQKWHKEHGGCGSSKEHDACMKKWGITIKKSSSVKKNDFNREALTRTPVRVFLS